MRRWLAGRLHAAAGRVHPDYVFCVATPYCFQFVQGWGMVVVEGEDAGVPIWYRLPDYARAWDMPAEARRASPRT